MLIVQRATKCETLRGGEGSVEVRVSPGLSQFTFREQNKTREWKYFPHTNMVCKFLKDPVFLVDRVLYWETQPPASIAMHWLSRSIFAYCRQYDVLDHTNHIFSVRIWSWQHVSVIISCIHCWVEPSLLLFCIIFIIISKAFYKSGLRVWWKLCIIYWVS